MHLALDAMLRGELVMVLCELQRGLGEDAHRTFVARLGGQPRSNEPAD